MKEMSGASGAEVARAFVVAEGAFGLEALKARIDALDGKVEAQCRPGFIPRSRKSCAGWACGSSPMSRRDDDLAATIALYRAGVEALRGSYSALHLAGTGQEAAGSHRALHRARRA